MWAFQHVAPSGRGLLTSVSAPVPEIRFDDVGDVLYLDIDVSETPAHSEMDEEEIFVFRTSEGLVTAFVIPYFRKYWAERIDGLINHISAYVPNKEAVLSTILRNLK